jgi:GGDEF domain-containing protein
MRSLLIDITTGLGNQRAFREAQQRQPASVLAFSTLEGGRTMNEQFGQGAWTELIKLKAEALKQAGVDSYRLQGADFAHRGDDAEELRARLEAAREWLHSRTVEADHLPTGKRVSLTGFDFSFGIAPSLEQAQALVVQHRAERLARGEQIAQ